MANVNKEKHAHDFPDYVFKPQKKEEKERERERKKQEKARDREAAKLRKEVEKNMRAGYLPPFMMSRPTLEVLQKLAFIKFSDLGPSPPVSQCPSPVITNASVGDESVNMVQQGTSLSGADNTSTPDADTTSDAVAVASTSDARYNACASEVDHTSASVPSSITAPPRLDNTIVSDAPAASSSDAPLGWTQYGLSSMSDIEAFINKVLPQDASHCEPNVSCLFPAMFFFD